MYKLLRSRTMVCHLSLFIQGVLNFYCKHVCVVYNTSRDIAPKCVLEVFVYSCSLAVF